MTKKGILFLLMIIFALTPGCKKQPKSVVHANTAIAAGSTLTVIGTGGIGGSIFATMATMALKGATPVATAALLSASFFVPPLVFIAAGITLIVTGVKKKKRIKKEQALAARTACEGTHDEKNLSAQD